MNIKETKNEKGTAYLEAQVTKAEIDLEKDHVLDEMIKEVSVKGFRPGKAPKAIAEREIDPNKLSNHIVGHVINHILEHAIDEHKYRLLGRPVLEDLQNEKNGDWTVKLQLPLYPTVKLGEYQKYLKSDAKTKKERKVEDIYDTLLAKEKVAVSDLIIKEEVDFSLERLTTQSKSLNLPLEDYLKAMNKNLEQVKEEYALSAEKSVKLDILLLEIAKAEKIDTDDKELLEFAQASNVPSHQLDQLRSIINRRKTIDFLMNL